MYVLSRYEYPGAVEKFLSPETQPGCVRHTYTNPNCLCDVVITDPVPLVAAPPQMYNVHNVDSLINAATAIWVEYDVIPWAETGTDGQVFMPENLSEADMRKIVRLVEEGMEWQDIVEAVDCGPIPAGIKKMVNRVLSRYNQSSKQAMKFETDIIVRLGNEGKSTSEIMVILREQYARSVDQSIVRRRYTDATGKKLAHSFLSPSAFPVQEVVDLHNDGYTPLQIRSIMENKTGRVFHNQSIRRSLRRQGYTPNEA